MKNIEILKLICKAIISVWFLVVFYTYCFAGNRSSQWPKVRAEFLKTHSTCAVCGSTKKLQVHHIEPYHLHPELELDPKNLITLCKKHHLEFGHGGNYKYENPGILVDVNYWHNRLIQIRTFNTKEKYNGNSN